MLAMMEDSDKSSQATQKPESQAKEAATRQVALDQK